eukprot:CAMPEP_0116115874 /NCGR_PEP_ID=MMETSP0329-20121206/738_1 /TAXON_ID=697910 /ORGANISM="Pseudo-nitzschia arenysensis, Strain B593" /LENGTH=350 /DNA_ID=CAMNT_0003609333 /DNA_START=93 /DNA_END=1144 /DNA_ORIENTATION=+
MPRKPNKCSLAGCMKAIIVGFVLLSTTLAIELNNAETTCSISDECAIPQYDEDEALKYTLYSKIAFCTLRKGAITGKDKVRFIEEGKYYKVQGFVAQIPNETPEVLRDDIEESEGNGDSTGFSDNVTRCVVSFRGSNGGKIANWIANLSYFLRDWPLGQFAGAEWCKGCKVHHGWAQAYDELKNDVVSGIIDLGCTSLILTGHSLGSAVATIASFDLRSAMGYHVEATWAFGKPRVGNRAFVDAFEAEAANQGVFPPVWRIVNFHDPVPRLPPSWLFSSFVHGGLEVYYTDRESSNYLVCPQEGKAENTSELCMGGISLERCVYPNNPDHVYYLNESFRIKDLPEDCEKK